MNCLFDSERKFMVTLHKGKDGNYILYEKGAPEKLLDKSGEFYHQGKTHNLTKEEREKLIKVYEKLTSAGLRVLGVATRQLKDLKWENKKRGKGLGSN